MSLTSRSHLDRFFHSTKPAVRACSGERAPHHTDKPVGSTYEVTERYCELASGDRQGPTKISFSDYTGAGETTFTFGQYHNGRRVGRWLVTDIAGETVAECIYANGRLLRGDPACPGS